MSKFNRIRVTLHRDDVMRTETQVEVFEHEIPILVHIYGQGMVVPVEGKQPKPAELEDGIDGEHARLLRSYRRPDTARSPASIVYPSPADLARALGVPYTRNDGFAPALSESVQFDGSASDDDGDDAKTSSKPRRGRPPKVAAEVQ